MTTYRLQIHEKATNDIKQITNYLKNIIYSKQAAFQFVDNLEKKYKSIVQEPHLYAGEWIGSTYYHRASINQYIIIFQIDEQTKTVHINAIGHSRQKRKNIVKG